MKKSLTILLALALLLPSVIFGSAADLTEVPAEAPAITAQAGETVDLTGYTYVSDGTSTPLSEYSWSSEDCEITGSNRVTVAEKGVYCLTGEKEGKQIRVYIVAAEDGDEDAGKPQVVNGRHVFVVFNKESFEQLQGRYLQAAGVDGNQKQRQQPQSGDDKGEDFLSVAYHKQNLLLEKRPGFPRQEKPGRLVFFQGYSSP